MKYLKKSAEVLIGKAGSQNENNLSGCDLADYTAMLAMTTYRCDGNEEEFSGICATRSHLEQIRSAIDGYLLKPENVEEIDGNTFKPLIGARVFDAATNSVLSAEESTKIFGKITEQVARTQNREQKQTRLEIDPKLVMVEQFGTPEEPNSWSAKLRILSNVEFSIDGKINLSAIGSSEEEVRTKLNTSFHCLIMACVSPDSPESRILDIIHDNQQPINLAKNVKKNPLTFDLSKTTVNEIGQEWEARIVYWNGCNIELTAYGSTPSKAKNELYEELIVRLQNQLSTYSLSEANEPESSKQVDKPDDKDSTLFKLNPSRVMSMKIGAKTWEARTRLFNGISDGLVDLVATGDSEEVAREELDKKFESFARPMTNFIKFMSQNS